MFWVPSLDPEAPPPDAPAASRAWPAVVEALVSDLAPVILAIVLLNLLWIGLVLTR